MDFDELDGPTKAPARTSRFVPRSKNAPPKPKPKPDPEPPQQQLLNPKPEAIIDLIPQLPEKKEETANGESSSAKMETDQEPRLQDDDPMEQDDVVVGEEEEEDVVVREIDVFFNPNVDNDTKLYVLQYPLRPRWRPYGLDQRCKEIRLNPETSEMEVDLSLDRYSKNCDQDFVERHSMTKQTLHTEWVPCSSTGYAVGVLMGNKLHLNPVHAVVQLRPSLEHLNPGGTKRKDKVTGDAEVTVKLENSNEEKSLVPSKKSWIPLKYHGSESDFSARYLNRMVEEGNSPIEFTMTPYDYVSSTCPRTCKGSSKRALLNLPLEERIQKLLVEEPVARRFSDLKKYFAPRDEENELLDVLQKYALLLRDLWVPKTALLYPSKEGSSRKNDDNKNLQTARNYILSSFTKNPVISYSQLKFLPPAVRRHVDEPLKVLAVQRPISQDWKFKEQSDVSYAELYPNIAKSQEEIWGKMDKMLGDALKNTKSNNASKPGKSLSSDRDNKRASEAQRVEGRILSDETLAALPEAIKEVILEHKVCNIQVIRDGLRKMAVRNSTLPKVDPKNKKIIAAQKALETSEEELLKVVSQVAINIHGLYVLISSPEHPEHDQIRNVVISLLQGKRKDDGIRKGDVSAAVKWKLHRDITNNEYTKVIPELCTARGSTWFLKTGDGGPK